MVDCVYLQGLFSLVVDSSSAWSATNYTTNPEIKLKQKKLQAKCNLT